MKKIGIFMIIASIILIGTSVFLLTNNSEIVTRKHNIYGGEFRNEVFLKSSDVKSKMKVTLPSVEETGFSCNGGSDFVADCESANVFLTAESNNNYVYSYLERGESLYNSFQNSEYVKYVKKLECMENSYCYIVKFSKNGKYPTNIEYFDLFIKGPGEKDYFEIRYSFENGNAIDFVDEILEKIKITYDATYTIGKVDNNKLNIRLKADTNEKEVYSYIDLALDSNKYHEVENGKNSNKKTIVKTDNSNNITLFYSYDINPYEGQKEQYIIGLGDTGHIIYYPLDNDSKYDEKIIDDNISLIHDKVHKMYYIRHSSSKSFLTVAFDNEKDSHLIDDFLNITGKKNGYTNK